MISLKSYSPQLVEHFNHPQNVGHFDEHDPDVHTGRAGCIESGDCVRIQLRIRDGIIEDICFKAQGSCATIAVASWVTEKVHHQTVAEIQKLTPEVILTELQIQPVKKHSVLIVLDALQKASRC
ncbi:MAG: iron-sulfur cluster assembly scaffold protein [Gammaproteobacteria bacterium]|nr:iron-sulfur cluster assembly scaffold protein [Gammaproteobacteria bacterium]